MNKVSHVSSSVVDEEEAIAAIEADEKYVHQCQMCERWLLYRKVSYDTAMKLGGPGSEALHVCLDCITNSTEETLDEIYGEADD